MENRASPEQSPAERRGISLGSLFFALLWCCVTLAIGAELGWSALLPATGITCVYLASDGRTRPLAKRTRLLAISSLALFGASLFLGFYRTTEVDGVEPTYFPVWQCLLIAFIALQDSLPQVIALFLQRDFGLLAEASMSAMLYTFALCSIGVVCRTVALGVGERATHIQRFLFIAVVLSTPVSWLIPAILGHALLGYWCWATAINLHLFSASFGKRVFYTCLIETEAFLFATKLFGDGG